MKHAIIVILMAFLLVVCTNDAFAGSIPFPRCIVDGNATAYHPVRGQTVNAYSAEKGREFIAEADDVNWGRPRINYNRNFMSSNPTEWNMQVMLHECAHLQLHHKVDGNYAKEYDADCSSAKRLQTEYKYTDEQFNIIAITMRKIKLPESRIAKFKSCINR